MHFFESFSDKGEIGLSSSGLCTNEEDLRNVSYFFAPLCGQVKKKSFLCNRKSKTNFIYKLKTTKLCQKLQIK